MTTRTLSEERWNAVTHGFGIVLALVAGVLLLSASMSEGARLGLLGPGIFSFALLAAYSSSMAYHWVRCPDLKSSLRVVDQCAIYLLIAGTYTPFALVALDGWVAWVGLFMVWSSALFGIALRLFFPVRFERFALALYLGIGWLALPALWPLISYMGTHTLTWLVSGGVLYTVGVVFYAIRRPYAHTVWHLFVLAGSICHIMAVQYHILP